MVAQWGISTMYVNISMSKNSLRPLFTVSAGISPSSLLMVPGLEYGDLHYRQSIISCKRDE